MLYYEWCAVQLRRAQLEYERDPSSANAEAVRVFRREVRKHLPTEEQVAEALARFVRGLHVVDGLDGEYDPDIGGYRVPFALRIAEDRATLDGMPYEPVHPPGDWVAGATGDIFIPETSVETVANWPPEGCRDSADDALDETVDLLADLCRVDGGLERELSWPTPWRGRGEVFGE